MTTMAQLWREVWKRDRSVCHICQSDDFALACYAEYLPSRNRYGLRVTFDARDVQIPPTATHAMVLCVECRYEAREDIEVMLRQFPRPSFGAGEVTMIVEGFEFL